MTDEAVTLKTEENIKKSGSELIHTETLVCRIFGDKKQYLACTIRESGDTDEKAAERLHETPVYKFLKGFSHQI